MNIYRHNLSSCRKRCSTLRLRVHSATNHGGGDDPVQFVDEIGLLDRSEKSELSQHRTIRPCTPGVSAVAMIYRDVQRLVRTGALHVDTYPRWMPAVRNRILSAAGHLPCHHGEPNYSQQPFPCPQPDTKGLMNRRLAL